MSDLKRGMAEVFWRKKIQTTYEVKALCDNCHKACCVGVTIGQRVIGHPVICDYCGISGALSEPVVLGHWKLKINVVNDA